MAKPLPPPKQPRFQQPPKGKSVLGPFQPTVPQTGLTFFHDIIRVVKVSIEPGFISPEVGDSHPDTNTYPNHVLIIPPIAQEDGQTIELIYGRLRTSTDQQLISDFGGGSVATTHEAFLDPEIKPTTDQGYLITTSKVEDEGSQRFLKETTTLDELDAPSLELTNGGGGYTSNPTVVFDSGSAVATAKVRYAVQSIGISNGGSE